MRQGKKGGDGSGRRGGGDERGSGTERSIDHPGLLKPVLLRTLYIKKNCPPAAKKEVIARGDRKTKSKKKEKNKGR